MSRSVIKVKPVKSIFRSRDEIEKAMRVHIARMCVLYEDLRVEYEGARADTLGDLDRTSRETRRFYFVRRTLGTLVEMEQAIGQLQRNKSFKEGKRGWPADRLKLWDEAVAFFESNHDFLKFWRNDVGGHFHDSAARFAIEDIHEDTMGVCEIHRQGNGADIKMKFAYELVAVAMTKNRKQQTEREFIEQAFTFLADAVKHAINASQVLVGEFIWPRFGGA